MSRSEPGWPRALVDVYEQERLALVRLAFLLVGDRHAAEEVVHDAFLSARRSWPTVRDPVRYMRTAVANASRSWGRRKALEQRTPPTPGPAPVPEPEPDGLWEALGVLKPRARAAIVLRFYEDLPDAEIAALLHCRPATVRTTIHRALATLRKEIER